MFWLSWCTLGTSDFGFVMETELTDGKIFKREAQIYFHFPQLMDSGIGGILTDGVGHVNLWRWTCQETTGKMLIISPVE